MDIISVEVGAVIGIVLSSIVWGMIVVSSKKQQKKATEQRDQKISSIAEILIEIDVLVTSNRSGQIKSNSFKTALSPKLEAINKILKLSMHNLDVYYVKYIESLLDQYNKLVYGVSATSAPVIPETPEIKKEDTVEFLVEKVPFNEEFTIKEPVTKAQVKESSKPVVSEKISDAKIPQDQLKSKIGQEKVSKQISPAIVDIKEKIVEKAPEEKNQNKTSGQELLVDDFEKEFEEAAGFDLFDPAGLRKTASEEDFALETIIDFDMSNINKIKQMQSKAALGKNDKLQPNVPQFKIAEKQIVSKPAEKKIEEEVQLEDFQPQYPQKDGRQEPETKKVMFNPPVKSSPKPSEPTQPAKDKEALPAPQDEQEDDFNTFFEIQTDSNDTEKKDVNITGDDISDQIDSFFNISKKK